MATVAGGLVASAVIGGIASKQAADEAAKGQRQASRLNYQAGKEAREYQEKMYQRTRSDVQPYMEAGQYGIDQYMQEARSGFNLPEFQQPTEADMLVDPSYQWRLDQGMEATTRALTKSGQAWGGQRGIALTNYAQNAASQEYAAIFDRAKQKYAMDYTRRGDILDRTLGIADMGRTTSLSLGQIGGQTSANIGNTITGTGARMADAAVGASEAKAAGIIGIGRAASGVAEGIGTMGAGGGSGATYGASAMGGVYSGGTGNIWGRY